MGNDTAATMPTHTGATLLCTLLAGGGAAAMATATDSLRRTAGTSYADQAMIGWMLVGLAALGTLLCLYLMIIWGLAAAILVTGPATRIGSALLVALRLLAPRLAKRVATGAAVATTATALALGPAMASEASNASSALSGQAPAQTAQLLPVDDHSPAQASGPKAAAPGSDEEHRAPRSTALLPPLGWGEEHTATHPGPEEGSSRPAAASAPTSTTPAAPDGGETSSTPHTVIVRGGDSLWSITEDLLGAGTTQAAEISATWPLLHDANQEVIGDDPDLLLPGMELTVPHSLTTKDLP